MSDESLLRVEGLTKHFVKIRGLLRRQIGSVKAVDGVSFSLNRGEAFALVGESGCGKTTTGRLLLRALEPTAGDIEYRFDDEAVDLRALDRDALREFRTKVAMIFQDPYSSLNPRMSVLNVVGAPLLVNKMVHGRAELRERVAELLRMVHLDPDLMTRYPHAFSGGQRQRIAIARALAMGPRFVVADECVSALDVSVQAQILGLLKELQQDLDLTYLFIAHNLAVVEYFSDRTAVMYVGKIVELATTETVFRSPKHPYTEALLAAVPTADPKLRSRRVLLSGEPADPADPPRGCSFHPRCRYAREICRVEEPPLRDVSKNGKEPHLSACHFAEELSLVGVPSRKPVPASTPSDGRLAPTNATQGPADPPETPTEPKKEEE